MTTTTTTRRTYTVIHPGGTFTRTSTREYTHAIIRRNEGRENFFVNLAATEAKAHAEARVHAAIRTHVDVVPFVDTGNGVWLALGRAAD